MKALLICLALAAGVLPVLAQTESAVEVERARIAAERSQADTRFAAQERACYRKFAVNDCLQAARSQRREVLSDLRRQELSLNEAERKGRAAERVRGIDERNSAQQQEDSAAQRAESVARRREKQEELAARAAERARDHASAPARAARTQDAARERQPASRAAKEPPSHDTAEALRQSRERQQEAQERRERVAKRLAEPPNPNVKPLPVPP
jgi:colicin import membrane protein